jgi:hypothetical protein
MAETGVIGFGIAFSFFCFLVLWIWRHNRLFFPILISISVLGFFDHWLWSMYAGLMVTSIGISLMSCQKEKSPDWAIN